MKTEDLIKEYIRTHKMEARDANRARTEMRDKPKTPVMRKG